ncbi:long-chain acyl-CoA synthetase [Caulobacter ginsengisoli]|uniref:Long-chain acyl-CoA synthetase n=1 Tax=Caulobacter ginsengisoli TaxID=400775 RepID=A0ABU0IUS4_9CAUL|nr:long-chain acyl-CoA synthetase [Caulobacter ginsengisoli]
MFDKAKDSPLSRRTWLSVEGRPITYGELADSIERVGGLLARHGVRPGDRVVAGLPDDGDTAILFLALICQGVTAVQIDPLTPVNRAVTLIRRARPALAIFSADLAAAWCDRAATWPVVKVSPPPAGRSHGLSALLGVGKPVSGLEVLLKAETASSPPATVPEETLAYILFTSGTTAESKGVCISHRALFAHLESLARVYRIDGASRILNTLMLSHADGQVQGPLLAFATGASCHRPVRFEIGTIERVLDSVFQQRITHMIAVPTMMSLIARLGGDRSDAFRGGDFKYLVSCGGALEAGLWKTMEETFSLEIINGYGLTETVAGGVFAGGGLGGGQRGSIGQPVDCELRIIDDCGVEAPEGELLIRGDLIMSGYFDDETLTRQTLVDGWLHTGDIARRDAAGDYWICGRRKSVIIRGGLNIHPDEITEVLNQHPGVRESVVFGEPDTDWGETVTALVAAEAEVTAEQLLAFCRDRLEPRKTPGRIVMTTDLPKGRSGKVILDEARALAASEAATRSNAGSNIEQRLLKVAAEVFGVEADGLSLDSSPRTVGGWDSLAHLNLVFAAEEAFAIQLSPRQIMKLDSLRILARFIESR